MSFRKFIFKSFLLELPKSLSVSCFNLHWKSNVQVCMHRLLSSSIIFKLIVQSWGPGKKGWFGSGQAFLAISPFLSWKMNEKHFCTSKKLPMTFEAKNFIGYLKVWTGWVEEAVLQHSSHQVVKLLVVLWLFNPIWAVAICPVYECLRKA